MENQIILQLLNGLVVGSSLALVASGLALLFGVLHIINFAQGDFFMMGGYAVWFALNLTHNYVLAMLVGTVLVAIGGGLLLTAVIWPLLQRSQVLVLLATLGRALNDDPIATTLPVGGFEDVSGSGNVYIVTVDTGTGNVKGAHAVPGRIQQAGSARRRVVRMGLGVLAGHDAAV